MPRRRQVKPQHEFQAGKITYSSERPTATRIDSLGANRYRSKLRRFVVFFYRCFGDKVALKTGDAPGQMASVVKMRGTEVGQKVTELAVEAVGWYGVPFTELRNYDSNIVPVGGDYVDDVSPRYFNHRKTTIYGGSSEVQRNVLAKAMLGL